MTGIITLRSKFEPSALAQVIVASLPTTWAATIITASGITGLTLPGMIELPGWSSGIRISPIPHRGPRAQQADVVGDGREAHGDRLEGARRPRPRRRAGPCSRTGWTPAGARGPSPGRAPAAIRSGNSRCVLIPVPSAVPPIGSSASEPAAGSIRRMPCSTWRGVARELLSQADRHRVLEVGPADLDDRVERPGPLGEPLLQLRERGDELLR